MTRNFLDIDDLTPSELATILDLAGDDYPPHVLAGRGVVLVFQKPSARTRSSSELAVFQLGGHPLSIRADEVGIDDREERRRCRPYALPIPRGHRGARPGPQGPRPDGERGRRARYQPSVRPGAPPSGHR